MLKAAGKTEGRTGIAIGFTRAEIGNMARGNAIIINLSDLGPEWNDRSLTVFIASSNEALADQMRLSSPNAAVIDQRRG